MAKAETAILDKAGIARAVTRITHEILEQNKGGEKLALIGIRTGGDHLATLLRARINEIEGLDVPLGAVDITMYRDDLNDPHGSGQPVVRTTEIDFDVDDKTIILADDVLFTGRSARAALDALIDLGRPKAIKLAVLVDRAGREFPIQADYAGFTTDVAPDQHVQVHFVESDGKDEVEVDAVE